LFNLELTAQTSIYAAERYTAFSGSGMLISKPFIEQSNPSCLTLIDKFAGFASDNRVTIEDMLMNTDASNKGYGPSFTSDGAANAIYYCSKSFPFIYNEPTDGDGALTIRHYANGGLTSWATNFQTEPLVIETFGTGRVIFEDVDIFTPNVRAFPLHQNQNPWDRGRQYSVTQGGEWDLTPFLAPSHFPDQMYFYRAWGDGKAKWLGYYPDPASSPHISSTMLTRLLNVTGGSPPVIGTYPLFYGGTPYTTLELYTGKATGGNSTISSAHLGASYGQTLNSTTVSAGCSCTATVAWNYNGQGIRLNIDLTTMQWLVPGMTIGLVNAGVDGGATNWYTIVETQPGIPGTSGGMGGYVTVIQANSNDITAPTVLHGTAGTNYTGTAILQPAFAFAKNSVPVAVPALSGTCTAPTNQTGNNRQGTFKTTTHCTAGQTVILTFADTAATGWLCPAVTDLTTPANVFVQDPTLLTSTTTATLKAPAGTTDNDVISFSCFPQ
jgi:hypothetical protein